MVNLIFQYKLPEQLKEINVYINAGIKACNSIKNSVKFQKMLEIFLLVGNIMNSGSSNLEGSFGFAIRFLPKFYCTKAKDSHRTLLHLVTKIIEEKHTYIMNFTEDISPSNIRNPRELR